MNARSMLMLIIIGSLLSAGGPAWAQMRRDPQRSPSPQRTPSPQPTPSPSWTPRPQGTLPSSATVHPSDSSRYVPHLSVALEVGAPANPQTPSGGLYYGLGVQELSFHPQSAGGWLNVGAWGRGDAVTASLDLGFGRKLLETGTPETGTYLGGLWGIKGHVMGPQDANNQMGDATGAVGPVLGLQAGINGLGMASLNGRISYSPLLRETLALRSVLDARLNAEIITNRLLLRLSLTGQQVDGPANFLVYGPSMSMGIAY